MDSDLDGTKRKACDSPTQTKQRPYLTRMINLGAATPPYTLAPYYHQESALRSTQSSSPYTLAPPGGQRQPLKEQLNALWSQSQTAAPVQESVHPTCIENYDTQSAAPQTNELDNETLAEADQDEDRDDWEWGVDTEDGADLMYMTNCKGDGSSWTRPLDNDQPDDLPLQTQLVLDKLHRAQQAAEEERKLANESLVFQAQIALERVERARSEMEEATTKRQTDILLRAMINAVKKKLQSAGKIVVESLGSADLNVKCTHPLCSSSDRNISPGAYYIILGHQRQLECTQKLWDGQGVLAPLPDPDIHAEFSLSASSEQGLSLDGAMDALRLSECASSPHAVYSPVEFSLPSSPITEPTSPPPQTGRLDQDAQMTSCDSTADSMSHARVAKKRGAHQQLAQVPYDQSNISSPTATPEKTAKIAKVSRELQGLFTGFGEAFIDGQREVIHGGRRSQRFKTASTDEKADDLVAHGETKPKAQTSKLSTVRPAASTKHDLEETVRAERRLADLYHQREVALGILQPEETMTLRPSRASKAKAIYRTRLDSFGIPYTDLLADSAKYSLSAPVPDTSKTQRVLPSGIIGPKPDKLLSSSAVQAWYNGQEDRYCFCHGVEGDAEMVQCSNEHCAVGWYHVDCAGEENVTAESWTCRPCSEISPVYEGTMPKYVLSSSDKYTLFAPGYAWGVAQRGSRMYGIDHLPHAESSKIEDEQWYSSQQGIPQLDGLPDVSTALTVPQPLSSIKDARNEPEHEIWAQWHGASTISQELPETPGTSRSLESNNSEGLWSSPTARLQYLAAYFVAGGSLDEHEKAALRLWQAASAEQVHWEQHLDRAEALRQERASGDRSSAGGGSHGQSSEGPFNEWLTDAEEEIVKQLEVTTAMSKKDCRGKELSTVFGELRSRGAL